MSAANDAATAIERLMWRSGLAEEGRAVAETYSFADDGFVGVQLTLTLDEAVALLHTIDAGTGFRSSFPNPLSGAHEEDEQQ